MKERRTGLLALAATVAVWGTWAWMTAALARFVFVHAPRIPLRDDLELVPFARPGESFPWSELWRLHNEHRVPLPKLLAAGSFELFGDVRAPMVLNGLLLVGLAAAMILVARRIRGSTSIVDVVFPLLWLTLGNAENLLMGFQLALILPAVLGCVVLLVAIARARTAFNALETGLIAGSILLLPLCGGPGITQAPAFAVLLVWILLARASSRTARLAAGAGLLALVAVIGLYLMGYVRPGTETPARDVARTLATAWRVVASSFAVAGAKWWPVSGIACALMAFVTLALLARAWRAGDGERARVVAILSTLMAVGGLSLAIGLSRGGAGAEVGSATRYITLPAPWIAAAVFAALLFGDHLTRTALPGALALALLAGEVVHNRPFAREFGAAQRNLARAFEADVLGPRPMHVVVRHWTGRVYPNRLRLHQILGWMAASGMAPFDGASGDTRRKYAKSIFDLPPEAIHAPRPPMRRFFEDLCDVLAVPTNSRLTLEVPDGARAFTGVFGVPPLWVQRGETRGIRAIVRSGADGSVLFERTIDPVRVAADRGPQRFEAPIVPGSTARIVLEITEPAGAPEAADWGYWADAYFE